ncbi:MAG: hypothetical protein PVG20_00775 [Thioalkalispiraceae bacterium]|jgi:hypothetical protein
MTDKRKQHNEYRKPLPRTEQSRQYDETLVIVKTQIDIIVNNNNSIHSWLNEVQAYLNHARNRASDISYDQYREYYDE